MQLVVGGHHVDVHPAQLLQPGVLGGVGEHHLVAAVLGRLLLGDQAGGVVPAALGRSGAAGRGTGVAGGDPDAHRPHPGGEVRPGRAGDAAVGDPLRGAHAEERLGGEHERPQVEALLGRAGTQLGVGGDQGVDAGQEVRPPAAPAGPAGAAERQSARRSGPAGTARRCRRRAGRPSGPRRPPGRSAAPRWPGRARTARTARPPSRASRRPRSRWRPPCGR